MNTQQSFDLAHVTKFFLAKAMQQLAETIRIMEKNMDCVAIASSHKRAIQRLANQLESTVGHKFKGKSPHRPPIDIYGKWICNNEWLCVGLRQLQGRCPNAIVPRLCLQTDCYMYLCNPMFLLTQEIQQMFSTIVYSLAQEVVHFPQMPYVLRSSLEISIIIAGNAFAAHLGTQFMLCCAVYPLCECNSSLLCQLNKICASITACTAKNAWDVK